jgi:hypothetical protein
MASKTLNDTELYEHTDVLKGKVVLITGASSGIGQVRVIPQNLCVWIDMCYRRPLLHLPHTEQKLSSVTSMYQEEKRLFGSAWELAGLLGREFLLACGLTERILTLHFSLEMLWSWNATLLLGKNKPHSSLPDMKSMEKSIMSSQMPVSTT